MDNYSYIGETQNKQSDKKNKVNNFSKYEARRTLFARDNFYKTVMAYMLCGMIASAFLYITYLIYGVFNEMNVPTLSIASLTVLRYTVVVIFALVGLFFSFAALAGTYNYICGMSAEPQSDSLMPDAAGFGDILSPLGSIQALKGTMKLFLLVALQLIAILAPTFAGIYTLVISDLSTAMKTLFIALTVFMALCLLLFIAFLLLPYPYIRKKEPYLSVYATYGKSASCALGQLHRAFSLFGSYWLLLILSILSFGVLLIVYAVPYMAHAYARLGAYMYDIYSNKEKK